MPLGYRRKAIYTGNGFGNFLAGASRHNRRTEAVGPLIAHRVGPLDPTLPRSDLGTLFGQLPQQLPLPPRPKEPAFILRHDDESLHERAMNGLDCHVGGVRNCFSEDSTERPTTGQDHATRTDGQTRQGPGGMNPASPLRGAARSTDILGHVIRDAHCHLPRMPRSVARVWLRPNPAKWGTLSYPGGSRLARLRSGGGLS